MNKFDLNIWKESKPYKDANLKYMKMYKNTQNVKQDLKDLDNTLSGFNNQFYSQLNMKNQLYSQNLFLKDENKDLKITQNQLKLKEFTRIKDHPNLLKNKFLKRGAFLNKLPSKQKLNQSSQQDNVSTPKFSQQSYTELSFSQQKDEGSSFMQSSPAGKINRQYKRNSKSVSPEKMRMMQNNRNSINKDQIMEVVKLNKNNILNRQLTFQESIPEFDEINSEISEKIPHLCFNKPTLFNQKNSQQNLSKQTLHSDMSLSKQHQRKKMPTYKVGKKLIDREYEMPQEVKTDQLFYKTKQQISNQSSMLTNQLENVNSYLKDFSSQLNWKENLSPVQSEFYVQVLQNNENSVKNLLLSHPDLVHTRFKNKETALHIACKKGLTKIGKILIDGEAELMAEDIIQRTPLYIAQQYGSSELEELILLASHLI